MSLKKCKCGCGEDANFGDWVHGHWNLGRKHSEKWIKNTIEGKGCVYLSEEDRQKKVTPKTDSSIVVTITGKSLSIKEQKTPEGIKRFVIDKTKMKEEKEHDV